MKDDPLKEKSMAFAVRAVKLAQWLREEKKEFSLADDCDELRRMLSATCKTIENNGKCP